MGRPPRQSIRNLYRPIQPSIKVDNRQIEYREFQPAKEIADYVYCFWQLKTISELKEPYLYRVVSDGCIDIFFELENASPNFIMGFCRKYTEFPIGKTFNYFGIRFLPSAFPALFQVSAKEFSNVSQALQPKLPDFSNRLTAIRSKDSSINGLSELLNAEFGKLIFQHNYEPESRFYNSLIAIFEKKGHLDIEQDLKTGFSPRQLRRKFNYYIGTTPKAFSNVVRFQHILNVKPSRQSLKENKIYFDVGFFDQAHFIKQFKKFYGVSPSEAFR